MAEYDLLIASQFIIYYIGKSIRYRCIKAKVFGRGDENLFL